MVPVMVLDPVLVMVLVLIAGMLLDAISSATGVEEDFGYHEWAGGGSPRSGVRAMQMIPDICLSQFMDVYGRSMRKRPESGNPAPTLGQALHMWAGPTYTSKISKQGGRLQATDFADGTLGQ